jgi:hypothetical protein
MQTLPCNSEIAAFYATYNDAYTCGGASGGKNLERYGRRYLELVQKHAARSGRLIGVGSSNNPFASLTVVRRLFEPLSCVMQTAARLELNALRYATRYGVGLAEATAGLPLKLLGPRLWQRLRDSRLHSFQGISYFVLKKT